jgi:hypothetical protein
MGARLAAVNFFSEDHVADLAVSPSAESSYPITNLQNDVSSDTWRSTSVASQEITGSFGGSARRISMWGIFPGRGTASLLGAQVRVQLYSDAARATQVYDSGTPDVFTWTGEVWGTFPWGSHPWGVEHGHHHVRLTPLLRWFSAVDVGSFKITITTSGAVDTAYFEASGFWLSDYTEAPYNALLGVAPAWRTQSETRRTYGGTLRRNRRALHRALRCEIVLGSEAERAAWHSLCYAAEPGNEIVLSLFQSGDGARLDQDFTVRGSLAVLNPVVWENTNFHKLQLEIEES